MHCIIKDYVLRKIPPLKKVGSLPGNPYTMRNTQELSSTENILETRLTLTLSNGFIVRAPGCVYVLSLMLTPTAFYKQAPVVDMYRVKAYVCFL